MGEPQDLKAFAPGLQSLSVVLGLLGLGLIGFGIFWLLGSFWSGSAFVGWLFAGLMGLFGFWSYRRAFVSQTNQGFLRFVVGGFLARIVCCGAIVFVVVGLELLDTGGFVVGLLTGFGLFMLVEVVVLDRAARNLAASRKENPLPRLKE